VPKAEQVEEVSVQQVVHYIAVLQPTDTVPVVLTTITAEQFVITLRVFGLPVATVELLIAAAGSHVQHS
jgi:formate-dependent phosphoribosylglycinamide formyltransferase (GAR transformylase)